MKSIKDAIELKKELDSLRPISTSDEQRIMQKFRLDWNYHSSNIEGNTLTYGETKALILFGTTAQGKPLKDHFEITGHNEVINWILEIIKDKRPLTENFIRQLHEILLKEPYEVDAITPDGKPTKKLIKVGAYKETPNHVKTQTGEIFYFATPEETPAKMKELLDWYRKAENKNDVEPILLAAEFHYRFIRIHPFDDGNGRLARILMNFILMNHGYPPIIIKTEDKVNYFIALQQADAGILESFFKYIIVNLIHSLEIMISGAKGECVEDKNDLDKELALLRQMVESKNKSFGIERSKDSIIGLFNNGLMQFFESFVVQSQKFESFYNNSTINMAVGPKQINISPTNFMASLNNKLLNISDDIAGISIAYTYNTFSKKGFGDFKFVYQIIVKFNDFEFELKTNHKTKVFKGYYSDIIRPEETKNILDALKDIHLNRIKEALNEFKKDS